ncbi:MAG: hypothetical protein R2831_05335 [Chitinophagaceae bacterium]
MSQKNLIKLLLLFLIVPYIYSCARTKANDSTSPIETEESTPSASLQDYQRISGMYAGRISYHDQTKKCIFRLNENREASITLNENNVLEKLRGEVEIVDQQLIFSIPKNKEVFIFDIKSNELELQASKLHNHSSGSFKKLNPASF